MRPARPGRGRSRLRRAPAGSRRAPGPAIFGSGRLPRSAGHFPDQRGGTLHVLEAARRKEFSGPILAVTSSEAYGRIPLGRPADESSPLRPVSPYGVSKAAADAAAQMYAVAYGLKVIRARSFAHTGPGQATEFVASA